MFNWQLLSEWFDILLQCWCYQHFDISNSRHINLSENRRASELSVQNSGTKWALINRWVPVDHSNSYLWLLEWWFYQSHTWNCFSLRTGFSVCRWTKPPYFDPQLSCWLLWELFHWHVTKFYQCCIGLLLDRQNRNHKSSWKRNSSWGGFLITFWNCQRSFLYLTVLFRIQ